MELGDEPAGAECVLLAAVSCVAVCSNWIWEVITAEGQLQSGSSNGSSNGSSSSDGLAFKGGVK